VSEEILNGTSAQFNTVPLTLVHVGKYRTEDKLKKTIHKLDTTQHSKNKTALVQSLLTTLSQETRWDFRSDPKWYENLPALWVGLILYST